MLGDKARWEQHKDAPGRFLQAKTYIHQLWADSGYRLEDLPRAMIDRDGLWKKVKEIRALMRMMI